MKIPFVDLKRLYSLNKPETDAAVARVLDSGWYIHGEMGAQFEKNFSKSLLNQGDSAQETHGQSVGCNSGTDAVLLSLLASNVGPTDEVITVSHTALPTVTAIYACGATPVFAEIDPDTWVMDTREIERLLSPKTKAIIAVHLYGNMVNLNHIRSELQRLGRTDVSVIEDCAQSQGSVFHGKQAGTFARFAAFSFYPTKNIGALGDAGAVYATSQEDARTVRMLANYGQEKRYYAKLPHGINSRMDEIQAAVLAVRLPELENWKKIKASQVEKYRTRLANLPLHFQKTTSECEPNWHLCVIALHETDKRDLFMNHLKEQNIETLIHYPVPNHLQPGIHPRKMAPLPITESLCKRIVSLPMNVTLAETEQDRVCDAILQFFAARKGQA